MLHSVQVEDGKKKKQTESDNIKFSAIDFAPA